MGLPRIIGITGFARHGKDTAASVLVRELGYSRVALADKMKELMLQLDPYIGVDENGEGVRLFHTVELEDWEGAKQNPEVRRLLQRFGTQVGREGLGEDTWIQALAVDTPGFYGNERKIVIPDVRFSNEAAFIRRMHGEVWGVDRPDFDNGLGEQSLHASERDIPLLLHGAEFTFVNAAKSASAFQEVVLRGIKNRMAVVKKYDPTEVPFA